VSVIAAMHRAQGRTKTMRAEMQTAYPDHLFIFVQVRYILDLLTTISFILSIVRTNLKEAVEMKKTFLSVLCLSVFVFMIICSLSYAAEKASYVDITPAEAKALIEKTPDIIIIDVSPAYSKGHLPKAVHYYIGDGSLDKAIPKLDKDKTYLVYCHIDRVSIQGAQKLIDSGFKKVYRLEGNYKAWVDAGYPIEK
jgi:rhodanese-related sulfurtransferase